MSIKPFDAHKPREPKKPHPVKNRPAVNLCDGFSRRAHFERTLFGMEGDIGERLASDCSHDAVENEHRRAVVLSLDYVPSL